MIYSLIRSAREMRLHMLAYNFRRAINVLGVLAIVAKLQAA